jgi:trimeric autotransporter adhesin
MKSRQRTMRWAGLLAGAMVVAMLVSCNGFFPDDTLQSIAVGPASVSVPVGLTQQMTATGTYTPSGNVKDVTAASGIVWQSSDNSATVTNTGVVTGVSSGTPTISATLGTVSGQASITIDLTNVTSIVITPTSKNIPANGGTATFQAMANVAGQVNQVDVSAQAVWTITNPGNYTLTQQVTPETVTTSGAVAGNIDTLTATYTSGSSQFTANATVTVTP